MARRSKTFEEAAAEVEERFGHRGIKLVEFEGTAKPCVINCPKHGNQTCSRYSNMFIGSSWGCPSCGNEQAAKAGIATLRKNHIALEMLKQAVTGMTKQERITTQAYNEMTKSVAGSNSIVLNDVQGDTTINNHHTHTHNRSVADGKALSMRLTPRPLLSTVRRRLSPVQANSRAVSTCLHRWSPLHNIRLPLPCPTRPCRRLSKKGICWWSSRVCALRTKTSC